MSIRQLSIFVENTPGQFARATSVLEQAKVSIRGFALSDTGQFGIARLVVDNPDLAAEALSAAGYTVKFTEVLCVELIDHPGELNRVANILQKADVNIEYAYSMMGTFVVCKVYDLEAAKKRLDGHPVRLVSQDDIMAFSVDEVGE
ncbi:MAG: hypothetical protein LBG97_00440 [Coriobacteriales bacterium]|nr:hypothetical protein [Coriobacteriales bacterium]